MPELPEVETALRGLHPHLCGQHIERALVREHRLRRVVAPDLPERLAGQLIRAMTRRGKYLLLELERGTLIVHLGMSGSLRIASAGQSYRRHDHIELALSSGRLLRFHDPRRFGIFEWTPEAPALVVARHPLLRHLGPEPLETTFCGDVLYRSSRQRRVAVKSFIMDAKVVVGVGNIYASESLFLAGIHPLRACQRISHARYRRLAEAIREVLNQSIEQGGTTLRDFVREDGAPGYFAQSLRVYERAGQPCRGCGTPIRQRRIGQRSSYYCPRCQH